MFYWHTMQVCFKRFGLSTIDYDASLPIKKRRFLVVQSPPSPSKDISSFHPDGKLLKTKRPSPSKDISSFHPDGNLLKTERASPSKDISSFHPDGNLLKTEQASPSKDTSSLHPDGNLLKTELPSPPNDASSVHPDDNVMKTEQPSLFVTTISSSSVVTSYGLSNKNQDFVFDENKGKSDTDSCYVDMVQSDIRMPKVEFQEPSLGGRACSNDYVEYEDKSLVTEEEHTVHASPESRVGLKLSSTSLDSDPLAGNKEEEIDVNKPEEKCSSPISQVEGGAGVLVDLKAHMDQILVPQKSDLNFLKQNSVEPVLLDLSLNKEGSSTHRVKGNVGSDYDGSLLHSKRENWDLNTSMESWEGCISDAPVVQVSATQTNTAIETHSCSSEMVESDGTCGKQTLLDSERKGNSINSCTPSKDRLHLCINSSYLKPMLEEDPYISEYESDGNWDITEAADDDDNNIEEDYEDGEVRETMLESEVAVHVCEKKEIESLDYTDCDDKKINSVGWPDHECFTLGHLEQETKLENLDVRSEDNVRTTTKSKLELKMMSRKSEEENEDICVKELHAVENTTNEDVNSTAGRSQLSQCDQRDTFEGEVTADKISDRIEELIPTVSQVEMENAIAVDVVQNKDLTLPVSSDDLKDINGGTRNSRIISLNRTTADSTPCKAKTSFVRSVLSRTDREFEPSMATEGANVQPQER